MIYLEYLPCVQYTSIAGSSSFVRGLHAEWFPQNHQDLFLSPGSLKVGWEPDGPSNQGHQGPSRLVENPSTPIVQGEGHLLFPNTKVDQRHK